MVRRAHAIGIAAVLVCFAGFVGSASGLEQAVAPAPLADQPDPSDGFGIASDRFARTTFEIRAYDNGSIRWTTRYAKPLNDSDIEDFRTFATDFNNSETELYQGFVSKAEALARVGTDTTNRTMVAGAFRKRAYVDQSALNLGTQGKVEMSFVLTNLSRISGERVVLGDVFDGGLYLQPSQKLVVEPGPGLAFASADPAPDSRSDPNSLRESDSVTWEGEIDFNDERPYLVFAPPSEVPTVTATTTATNSTTTATTTTTTTTERSVSASDRPGVTTTADGSPGGTTVTTPAASSGGAGGTMLVAAVIVLLLGVGTVAVWRVSFGDGGEGGPVPAVGGDGSDGSGGGVTTESPAAPDTGAAEPETEETAPEEELLTDSDRVQKLLDENGGRMRQSAIVEDTEWSKSKVSMLLSDMEDDDEITKLRVGRENIISLPGQEPEAAGSPFEDEQ